MTKKKPQPLPPMEPPQIVDRNYLLRLITGAHNKQPRYMETIGLTVQPFVDGMNLAFWFLQLFDLNCARGQQLDFIGEWVGLSRWIPVPTAEYFSLDICQLGLDEGRWKAPYDVDRQIMTLGDADYRHILQARIRANFWNGTIDDVEAQFGYSAYDVWDGYLKGTDNIMLIQDGFGRGHPFYPPDQDIYPSWQNDYLGKGPWVQGQQVYQPRPPTPPFPDPPPTPAHDPPLNWPYFNSEPRWPTHSNMTVKEVLCGPIDPDCGCGCGCADDCDDVPPPDPCPDGRSEWQAWWSKHLMESVTLQIWRHRFLGLKSAGVAIHYMIQSQPDVCCGFDGTKVPLFGFDVGPEVALWCSFDIDGLGHDEAPLWYPGAVPDFSAEGHPSFEQHHIAGLDVGAWGIEVPLRTAYADGTYTPAIEPHQGGYIRPDEYGLLIAPVTA